MHLKTYLAESKLSQAAFGALLVPAVTQSLVSQWLRGEARVTLSQAVQIEKITEGQVTPAELSDLASDRDRISA